MHAIHVTPDNHVGERGEGTGRMRAKTIRILTVAAPARLLLTARGDDADAPPVTLGVSGTSR